MIAEHIAETLNRIRFEHHQSLHIRWSMNPNHLHDWWIQIQDDDLPVEFNTGRKWRISIHMTRSEIVQTAFSAYLAWVEHEARESFLYRGQSIFGPHYDVEALWELAIDRDAHEYRESA